MTEEQERLYLLTSLYNRDLSIASVESIWSDRVKKARTEGAKVALEQGKDHLEDV